MLTTFKVKYLYADNSELISQVHKSMPYINPTSSQQVMGLLCLKGGPFL